MILLTHKSCLDGYSCKIVFEYFKKYDATSKIFFFNYPELDTMIPLLRANAEKDEEVYIIDINYKKIEEIEKLKEEFPKLVYIDHHKYDDSYYDRDFSNPPEENISRFQSGERWLYCPKININAGGKLFFDYAYKKGLLVNDITVELVRIENFLLHASDYDTWMWKKNDNFKAENLAKLFYNLPRDIFEQNLNDYLTGKGDLFSPFFEKFLELKDIEAEEDYVKKTNNLQVFKDIEGNRYVWFQLEFTDSPMMNRVLLDDRFKHVNYAVCYNTTSKTMSFRSREDFDVSVIAKKYGGGGHAQAAGCNIPEHLLKHYKI